MQTYTGLDGDAQVTWYLEGYLKSRLTMQVKKSPVNLTVSEWKTDVYVKDI